MAFSLGGSNGGLGGGRRRFGAGNGALSEINIVPLVDVVLVLLIIFMLTAHVMDFGLEIDVPQVKTVRDSAEELPVVSIDRKGKLYLNDKLVNIHQLPQEVARRFKNAKSVYVMVDRAAIFDPFAQVVAELSDAKIQVKVVTKPIDKP
jgi:biopolymer transport protein ExbD